MIVLNRNVDTSRITQFMGGDNVLIGKAAGECRRGAARRPRQGPGRRRHVGRHGHRAGARSPQQLPCVDRQGARDQVPAEQPVRRLEAGSGLQHHDHSACRNNEKIDLVYGHNDPMAYGAYLAIKDAGAG